MDKWIIQHPIVIDKGETVRLNAVVLEGGRKRELWYEAPSVIKDCLFDNCLDAFLVVVLPLALRHGSDIEVKGRISERLYHSLVNNVIPLLTGYSRTYHPIRIVAGELFAPPAKGHAGTGFSCGVDSFDTIMSLMQNDAVNPLDTLTFFNVGSHRSTSGFDDNKSRTLFDNRRKMNEEASREIGLPLFVVDSNIGQYLCEHNIPYVQTHIFCVLSAVLVCGSYFSHYCYSSGYTAEQFNPRACDNHIAYVELCLTSWLSTEYIDFFSSGFTKTRMQKVKDISDSPLVQRYLNVCWMRLENCGKCQKCVRTLMEIYSI